MNTNIYDYFSSSLLAWFHAHGRKNLPWQYTNSPYKTWISEIMLQQTQVQTVIPYFNRFIARFPIVHDLAKASLDEVLSLWSGLGYYSRARYLHQTAQIISLDYQGQFPSKLELLLELPGIGPSTAAAILSLAFNQATPILDGNVKRVLARFFLIRGAVTQADTNKKLWELAHLCMPDSCAADYTQAIMDLGALCCTLQKPNCAQCPLQEHCLAFKCNEQLNYPNKNIKKSKPIRHQQFLVLINREGFIYLEQRKAPGLWGGLWCLPSINMDECPLTFIKTEYTLEGETPEPLLKLSHTFSHFTLKINALRIRVSPHSELPKGRWFTKEALSTIGLAKPTQLILNYSV